MIFARDNIAFGYLQGLPPALSALDEEHPASSYSEQVKNSVTLGAAPSTVPADVRLLDNKYLLAWFRILSASIIVKHYWFFDLYIDFGTEKGKMLKRATPLAKSVPIYPNHSRYIEEWVGISLSSDWTSQINQESVAGINSEFRLWTGLDAGQQLRSQRHFNIAEGVRQQVLSRVSSGVVYQYRKSHPDMDDSMFYKMMGKKVDDEMVRLIVTDIVQFVEFSLVQMGADRHAQRERNREMRTAAELSLPITGTFSEKGYQEFTANQAQAFYGAEFGVGNHGQLDEEDFEQDNEEHEELAVSLNRKGQSHASSLIKAGKYNATSSWSFSSIDGNKLLGTGAKKNWTNYGKWFLAVESTAKTTTKAHWKYPFGKIDADGTGKVFRSALVAIRQRAGQQGATDVFNAAGTLLAAIDKKLKTKQTGNPKEEVIMGDKIEEEVLTVQDTLSKEDGVEDPLETQEDGSAQDIGEEEEVNSSLDEDEGVEQDGEVSPVVLRLTAELEQAKKGYQTLCERYSEAVAGQATAEQSLVTTQAEMQAKELTLQQLKEENARLLQLSAENAEFINLGKQYLEQLRQDTEVEYLKYCASLAGIPNKAILEDEKAAMLTRIKEVSAPTLRELYESFLSHNSVAIPETRISVTPVPGNGSSQELAKRPLFGDNMKYLYQ